MAARRALIILAEGAEEMEVVITTDVLRRANINVTLAGLFGAGPVRGAHKILITPDAAFDDAVKEKHDVVILPGGLPGSQTLADTEKVGVALREQFSAGRLVAAICAAPIAFASHKISPGCTLTSYPGFNGKLVDAGYKYSDARVVVDGKVVTSRGPGTAFEFALKLVELLANEETAAKLHEGMLLPK